MSSWTGPLAGLRELPAVQGLTVTPARKVIDHAPIAGGLIRMKYPNRWRVWTARHGLLPAPALARLRVLADLQEEPWWFIPDDAPRANVMTPAGSRFEDWSTFDGAVLNRGGYAPLVDGDADTSVNPDYDGDDWNYQSRPIPIPPGAGTARVNLYGRAFIGMTGQMRVQWVDGYGAPVFGANPSAAVSTTVDSGPLPRLSMLADPATASPLPATGAAGLVIQTRRLAVMANPAVTWTTVDMPWAEGKSAERAWLEDPADTLVTTGPAQRHAVDFRVVEEVPA